MRSKEVNRRKIQISKFTVYIVLVVVFIFFSIILRDKGFMTGGNLLNVLELMFKTLLKSKFFT